MTTLMKKDPEVVAREQFLHAYLTAALWSTNDNSDESGGYPLGDNYGVDDIAPESVAQCREDCNDFIDSNRALLDLYVPRMKSEEYTGWERAGHDFWLTRNGHGAGFWDRGLGELGDRLTKATKAYGGRHLYVGDDGKVYSE